MSTTQLRLGLCCAFRDEPIKFATTTAAAIGRLSRADALAKLSRLALANAESLMAALAFCERAGIGCFRINSQILPVKTHPTVGYEMDELPENVAIVERFRECGVFAEKADLRLVFHPDQFVVLNSPRADVVASSVRELEYQAEVCEWVGADVVNIHAGGVYGNKSIALETLARNLPLLSERARRVLTVENDDTSYTPEDIIPVCRSEGIPLVYDVHHHRCREDGLNVEEATDQAVSTWNREPLFHLSSPINGWNGPAPQRHHDFIDPTDFPACWLGRGLTVEVEAKAKEVAVLELKKALRMKNRSSIKVPSRR